MLGSPLYKPFIKVLEDETSKKDDQLKFRGDENSFDPSIHEKIFFQ